MNSGGEGGGRDVIMVEEAYKECTMVVRVEGKMLEWWKKRTRSEQWW